MIRAAGEAGLVPLADPANPPQQAADLLASFRRTVADWLLAPLDDLVAEHRPAVVAASGGVAANLELRRRLLAWGERAGVPWWRRRSP